MARCLKRSDLAERLQSGFHEISTAHGISADGTLLELFVGPEGTFTAAKIMPNGIACIVDFGSDWQTLLRPAEGGDPSASEAPKTPLTYRPDDWR